MRTVRYQAQGPLPWPVRLLIAARAVNQLGAFSLAFLTVLLCRAFGAGLGVAGAVSALFGLATIPGRLAGGWLAGQLGRRRTMLTGLGGCAVAQLGIALAPGLVVAAGCALALGLAFELYEPPSQALIADTTAPQDHARAYALLIAALAAGNTGAGLIAAAVGRWGLRWLFVVDALSCLACAVIVRLALPADHRPRNKPDRLPAVGPPPWRDRNLLAVTGTGTVFALIYMLLLVSLPLSLNAHGLNPAGAGAIMAVSAVAQALAQPSMRTRRLAAIPNPAAFAIGYTLMGVGLAGYAAAGSLLALIAPTAAWSLGYLLLSGRAFAVVAGLAPAGATAAYLAVYGLSWGVATTAAPVLAALLIGSVGPAGLWISSSALCLVMAAVQRLGRRADGTGLRLA
ncbi:MAG TPA: MFS transporter [Streptosporangiaceae bacterium]|nr:MFS transporter [Streptosporangiaceae bacterium]